MPPLKPALLRLRALLLTQRTLRLLLRAAWMGLAGYLLGWGLHALTGVLPDSRTWGGIGLALALPALLGLFRPLPLPRLTWNLDRRFALREQLSAAWQTAQQTEQTRLSTLLLEETTALLPAQRARVLRRGWFLERDLLAALIVTCLLITINTVTRAKTPYSPPLQPPPLALPALAEAPTYEDLFPSGLPGLTEPLANPPAAPAPLTPDQAATLDDLLSDLGEALSENPETAPAGEALQEGDLATAAAELERLADELDDLPPDTRENTEEALRTAAAQAQQAGEEDLAEALEQAAGGMDAPSSNNLEAAEALDDLASEFRQLEDQMATMGQAGNQEPASEPSEGEQPVEVGAGGNAAGSGDAVEGPAEPLERIEGTGQTLEVEGDETPSGLLAPGDPATSPGTGESGPVVVSGNGAGDTAPVESILAPYYFPWRWRDVVSKYFSPPQ